MRHPFQDAFTPLAGDAAADDISQAVETYALLRVDDLTQITTRDLARTFAFMLVTPSAAYVYAYDPDNTDDPDGTILVHDSQDRPFIRVGKLEATGTDVAGLQRVRLVATVNVDVSADLEAGDTIDGAALAAGDAVLLTAQTAPEQNGVYVAAATGAAARHPDFAIFDALPGTFFSVMEGSSKADTLWRCTSDRGGTVDTDAVAISEFTAGGGGSPSYGDTLINGKIVASVNSNALTIELKTLADADPSAGSPVEVTFRAATLGAGGYSKVSVEAATSLVISSGSTLGASDNTPFRLWVVIFNDGSLGLINCRTSSGIAALTEFVLRSSTGEGGAGGADSAGVIYTASAVTTKPFRIVGFLEWQSGLTTAGTWDAAPDVIQPYGPGGPKPGEIIQTVQASTQTQTAGTLTSYTDTALSVSLTPTSPCNLFAVSFDGPAALDTNAVFGFAAIRRGGAVVAYSTAAYTTNGGTQIVHVSRMVIDFPGTSSSVTWVVSVRLSSGGGPAFTFPVNGGGSDAGGVMQATEIMG